jgi:hypothetical protein
MRSAIGLNAVGRSVTNARFVWRHRLSVGPFPFTTQPDSSLKLSPATSVSMTG